MAKFNSAWLVSKRPFRFVPDLFPVPVSRWNEITAASVAAHPALSIVAQSDEAGLGLLAEVGGYDEGRFYPRRLYALNHPEYDTETLKR